MSVIQCNGADLYYEDNGAGQPIVFLHGATAGLRYFEPQLTALSGDYRTIGIDFRGHGRSEKTELGHTIKHYADDVRSFLEQLDLDDVILVGWSGIRPSFGEIVAGIGPISGAVARTRTGVRASSGFGFTSNPKEAETARGGCECGSTECNEDASCRRPGFSLIVRVYESYYCIRVYTYLILRLIG